MSCVCQRAAVDRFSKREKDNHWEPLNQRPMTQQASSSSAAVSFGDRSVSPGAVGLIELLQSQVSPIRILTPPGIRS